jgi:type III secretion protein J
MCHILPRWLGSLVLFALLFSLSGCTSRKIIVHGVEEQDGNEVVVFLSSRNIPAYKTQAPAAGPGGGGGPVLWDVAVDGDRSTEAMSLLNANGLPRRRGQKLLEIFAAGGLVPSEMQEKIRYQAGLAAQIANTIRKIDGVIDADVQLSFPEEDPLNPRAQKALVTAAVFVKHNGVLDNPNNQLIPKIRRLVAASVQGLNYDSVTVIPVRAQLAEPENQPAEQVTPGGVEMVKVWTIPIAKGAVGRFQAIFISLIALTAVFILCTFWLLWKITPVARECGGMVHLLSFHPLELPNQLPPETEEGAPPAEEGAEKKPEEKPKVQENVESP